MSLNGVQGVLKGVLQMHRSLRNIMFEFHCFTSELGSLGLNYKLVPREVPVMQHTWNCLGLQEVGTTLLMAPSCLGELHDFNDFCSSLEQTIEHDEVRLS